MIARMALRSSMLIALALLLAGCSAQTGPAAGATAEGSKGDTMQLTSSEFRSGEMIPAKYTCDGENVSPPLAWTGVPPEAKALALIVDDPDAPAGTWVHWVVLNLPTTLTGLPVAVRDNQSLGGAIQGTNSYRKQAYGGPCPPSGTHRYYFRLFALDGPLAFTGTANGKDAQAAMKGHVLATAELMARYTRR